MRILITGGAGFIGSHIAEHYASKAEVRVLDNLRSGYKANLDGLGVEFIEGSVTDRQAVKKAVDGVDYIFHMAAMISVPSQWKSPLNVLRSTPRARSMSCRKPPRQVSKSCASAVPRPTMVTIQPCRNWKR